jgi:hypothetical protein
MAVKKTKKKPISKKKTVTKKSTPRSKKTTKVNSGVVTVASGKLDGDELSQAGVRARKRSLELEKTLRAKLLKRLVNICFLRRENIR